MGLLALLGCSATAPNESTAMVQQKVVVPEAEPASDFTFGAAIVSDDQTLIVGDGQTHLPTPNGGVKGSAYVYTRNANTNDWALLQTLRPDQPTVSSEIHFGSQLTLAGNTLVVAEPRDLVNGIDAAGSFSVFTRSGPGGQFTQVVKVPSPNPSPSGFFALGTATNGNLLAVSGGQVGNPNAGVEVYSLQGAAHLYHIATPSPAAMAMTQAGVLVCIVNATISMFRLDQGSATAIDMSALPSASYAQTVSASGSTVALLDQANGGGVVVASVDTARVSAASRVGLGVSDPSVLKQVAIREGQNIVVSSNDSDRPSVYWLKGSGTSYALQGRIYPPLTDRIRPTTAFGDGLALGSDFVAVGESDADGLVEVLPLELNDTTDGATFEQQKLVARDTCSGGCAGQSYLAANFGNLVALSDTLAVVAENNLVVPASRPSNVHIYTRQGSSWTPSAEIDLQGKRARALAISAGRILIGQGTFVPPGSFSDGSVRVLELQSGTWNTTATISTTVPANADARIGTFFGDNIAADGDTLAVGTFHSAYVYTRDTSGAWNLVHQLDDPATLVDNNSIARRVAISPDYVLVSAELATFNDNGSQRPQLGTAFVYQRNGWALDQQLNTTTTSASDLRFGRSIAISGTTVVVGVNGGNASFTAGEADVFERTGTGSAPWVRTATLAPRNGFQYGVGTVLALSNDQLLIGAVSDPLSPTQNGAAYLVSRVNGVWDLNKAHTLLESDDTGAPNASFGWSAALNGSHALIGAIKASDGTTDFSGAAYTFDGLVDADQDGLLAADDCDDTDGVAVRCARAQTFANASGNLSFEQLSAQAWSASSGSFTIDTAHHTDGHASLNVGAGPVRLNSPTLATATLHEVGTTLALDVFRSTAKNDALTLLLSAPSLGVNQSPIGTIDLSNLPVGKWLTVATPIPLDLRDILLHRNTNVTLSLFLNQGGPGLFLDRLHFAGQFARHVSPAPAASGSSGAFSVTSDWGAGYCVVLKLDNSSAVAANGWQVAFDSNGSTLTSSWNAAFSGTSGALTITNNQTWNALIPAGAVNQDVSVGFCANRGSGTQALPIVTGVTTH